MLQACGGDILIKQDAFRPSGADVLIADFLVLYDKVGGGSKGLAVDDAFDGKWGMVCGVLVFFSRLTSF